MNRSMQDYLVPLALARGELPLGRLIYHATGKIAPVGQEDEAAMSDLEALQEKGYIRFWGNHVARHRRIEYTVLLTAEGYAACTHVIEAERLFEFERQEKELDEDPALQDGAGS